MYHITETITNHKNAKQIAMMARAWRQLPRYVRHWWLIVAGTLLMAVLVNVAVRFAVLGENNSTPKEEVTESVAVTVEDVARARDILYERAAQFDVYSATPPQVIDPGR